MKRDEDNVILTKTYAFSLEIIKLYKDLIYERKEFVLSKQLLRAGTAIGAGVNEAIYSESKKDFVHKLHISLKEARETYYWLRLLRDSDFIDKDKFEILKNNVQHIMKILTKIITTTKEKYLQ